MIQVTPQMRILLAVEPVDFRKGIDGLAGLCRGELESDPFSGTVFVFIGRSAKAVKILVYDGQGFWLAQKRLSTGHFRYWPRRRDGSQGARVLVAHELSVLLSGGDPASAKAAPEWRRVSPE